MAGSAQPGKAQAMDVKVDGEGNRSRGGAAVGVDAQRRDR
jgi:hypothetical protein